MVADAHITINSPDSNAGGNDAWEEGSCGGGAADHKDVMMRFDVSSLPAGVDIDSASLEVWYWYRRACGADNPHDLFVRESKRVWNEGTKGGIDGAAATAGEVTWNAARHTEENWDMAGAVGASDVGNAASFATLNPALGQQWVAFDVKNLVKKWAGDPAKNLGVKITQNAAVGDPAFAYVDGIFTYVSSEIRRNGPVRGWS